MDGIWSWLTALDTRWFIQINRGLEDWARTDADSVIRFFNQMGGAYVPVMGALVILLMGTRLRPTLRRLAEWGVANGIVGAVIQLLKRQISRPRPQAVLEELFASGEVVAAFGETARHNAMPSGHTATAFTMAVLLAGWSRSFPGHWRRRIIAFLVFLTACGTGLARIRAGVHWPLDVAAGAVLGMLGGLAVLRFSAWAHGCSWAELPLGTPYVRVRSSRVPMADADEAPPRDRQDPQPLEDVLDEPADGTPLLPGDPRPQRRRQPGAPVG